MNKTHKHILEIISKNEDVKKLIAESFSNQKVIETTNATVKLPKSVVSDIAKLSAGYDYSTKQVVQLIVTTFTYMEKYFQNEKDDFRQNLLLMKDALLEDKFYPTKLVKKSYMIYKRDAIHLKVLAKSSSISRDELISMGVMMVMSHMKQNDEEYDNYVRKYKIEFERILTEIQEVKKSALNNLDRNDQIVLMAERLEGHLGTQLNYYDKFQQDGIWYVGPSDSENLEYGKLWSDLLFSSKSSRKRSK